MGYEVGARAGQLLLFPFLRPGLTRKPSWRPAFRPIQALGQLEHQRRLQHGWEMFEDPNDACDFLGGVKWHNDEKTTSLSSRSTSGPKTPPGTITVYDYALVFKQQLSEETALRRPAQHGRRAGRPAAPAATAAGTGWTSISSTPSTPSTRPRDSHRVVPRRGGTRVAGIGNLNYGWTAQPGFEGTFTELTSGLNWRPPPQPASSVPKSAATGTAARPTSRANCPSATAGTANS